MNPRPLHFLAFEDLRTATMHTEFAGSALRQAGTCLQTDSAFLPPLVELTERLSKLQDDLYAFGVSLGSSLTITEGSITDA